MFAPYFGDFVLYFNVKLYLVLEHAQKLVPKRVGTKQFGSFVETELKPFFDGVIVRVVDNIVGTQVISFKGNYSMETGDFGGFVSEGEQPDEGVDELFFARQYGQVEHEMLDFSVFFFMEFDSHGKMHFVEGHLHADNSTLDPLFVSVVVEELEVVVIDCEVGQGD